MNVQGSGTSRRDAQEQGTRGPAPAPDNKNTLYIGIGGGALVFVLILAFMLSGGESQQSSGISSDKIVNRAIDRRRRPTSGASTASAWTSARRPSATQGAQELPVQRPPGAGQPLQGIITLDATAQTKVGEFKKRDRAAKADQTAMAKANDLYAECLRSWASTAPPRRPRTSGHQGGPGPLGLDRGPGQLAEGLQRHQGADREDVPRRRRFGEAIREWQRFGETSQDPLLHSRIEQEVRTVNQQAQAAAEKVVAEAGGDRTKLEEAQQRFSGTDGQAVINKAMKGIK
jgi:hypothetical protein